jgi:flagellar biosynthesis/type III secretory pathway chaperone
MIDSTPAHFEELLAAELRTAETIALLTERERIALQANDSALLAEIINEKEGQMAEWQSLETERQAVTAALVAHTSDDPNPLPAFNALLAKVGQTAGARLKVLADGIAAQLRRTRALNAGNRALLQVALDRNAAVRDFLIGIMTINNSYDLSGDTAPLIQADHFVDWSG